MSTAAARSAPSIPSEASLLARLGLPANSDPQTVERAHAALIDYLADAPVDLRPWARREIDLADEAFALLSDPTIDRSAAAAAEQIVPATRPTAARSRVEHAAPEAWDDEIDEVSEVEEPARPKSRTTKRARRANAHLAVVGAPEGGRSWARRLRRPVALAAGAAALLAVVVAVYNMGGGTGIPGVGPNPVAGAAASPAVDTARVAELMGKIAANPKDVASLQSLADIYYLANDFETAAGFLEKIVAIDATDVNARLALGASYFNLGKPDRAETQWRAVIAQEPNNLEAHYDLGFMYLSRTPADLTSARAEWQKVIAIAPDSDVARTIEQHLANLDPAASPRPSAGSSSPAASALVPASGTSGAPGSPATSAPPAKGN
jgi:tetratricopeptide (TPR) repeat protein